MANRDFIYGRQPVREVLRAHKRRITKLFIGDTIRITPELKSILSLADEAGVGVEKVKRHRLQQMAGGHGNHQGVAIEAGRHQYVEWGDMVTGIVSDVTSHNPLLLILDRIQDPQNLGSLLRTADAMGVALVVLPKERAAHITPAVVRASAGASEHVPVCIVTNIARCLDELTEYGVQSVGLEYGPDSIALAEFEVAGPLAVVVGSEGKGLRRLVKEKCSRLASVPMHGRVNSLNAAIAGAIAMYQLTLTRAR